MDRTAIQPPLVMYYDDLHLLKGKKDWSKSVYKGTTIYKSPDKKETMVICRVLHKTIPSFAIFYKRDENSGKMKGRRDGRPWLLSFDTETAKLIERSYHTEEGFMEIRD